MSGRLSSVSWGSSPAMGQPLTLRTLSMPLCCVVSPAAERRCRMRGASMIVIQRSCRFWRVVRSHWPRPKRFAISPMAATCSLVRTPLGMRGRSMKKPGVARRWNSPYHLRRSWSSGGMASKPSRA